MVTKKFSPISINYKEYLFAVLVIALQFIGGCENDKGPIYIEPPCLCDTTVYWDCECDDDPVYVCDCDTTIFQDCECDSLDPVYDCPCDTTPYWDCECDIFDPKYDCPCDTTPYFDCECDSLDPVYICDCDTTMWRDCDCDTLDPVNPCPCDITKFHDCGCDDDTLYSFKMHVQPIFDDYCIRCHDPNDDVMDLTYPNSYESIYYGGYINKYAPEASKIYKLPENGEMPPDGQLVPDELLQILLKWIEQGFENN